MNSKEAIKTIRFRFAEDNKHTDDAMLCDTIEHDINLLELLKRKHVDISVLMVTHIVDGYNYTRIIDSKFDDVLSVEEFNSLKEWLNV